MYFKHFKDPKLLSNINVYVIIRYEECYDLFQINYIYVIITEDMG